MSFLCGYLETIIVYQKYQIELLVAFKWKWKVDGSFLTLPDIRDTGVTDKYLEESVIA